MKSLTNGVRDTLWDLRHWSARRWLTVAVVSVTVVGVITVALGLWAVAPWWTYAIIGAAAVLSALTVASYIGAPPGAEATFCDLRWPVIGLISVAMAVDSPGHASPLTGLFGSSLLASTFTRTILVTLALVLLTWALTQRMTKERSVTHDPGAGETCTTCRPLFPAHSFPPHDRHPEGDLPQ